MSGSLTMSASPWIAAVGWTLVHSLWQGACVAIALGVVLRALGRAPSQARYLAACSGMALLVGLPIASLRPPPRPVHPDTTAATAIGVVVPPGTPDPAPAVAPGRRFADRLEPMLPAVVALWMAGVGVFSMRLLGGWLQAWRWARHQVRPLGGDWLARVDRLKERLGVRRAVVLLESAWVEVPMVVGWLRPAILVPVAALWGLSAAEVEAILAHELAHVRRHDYLVNVMQCVVEVLMFYHPAAWWISGAIRRERECCCDDLAVAACGDRLAYARALAAMEGLRTPAFSPSAAANGGVLLARIRRILNPQEESMNPVRILAGLGIVVATAPLWLACADTDQPAPSGAVDLITRIEQAPTGRFMIEFAPEPAGPPAQRKQDQLRRAKPLPHVPKLPEGPIAEVRFEGNVTIPGEKLKVRLLSKVGQPFDPQKIDADVRSLMRTNWFSQVEGYRDESPPKSGKYALVFSVREMPALTHVEFRGRKAIRLKQVEDIVIDRPIIWHVADSPERAIWERVQARIDRLSRDIAVRKHVARLDQLEQDPIYNRMIGELNGLMYLQQEWKASSRTPSSKNP